MDRILVSREWDAYGKMIEVLNHCLAQVNLLVYTRDVSESQHHLCDTVPVALLTATDAKHAALLVLAHLKRTGFLLQDDVEQPGSDAYNVLINMHQVYGWGVNSKVCSHPGPVQMQRLC